VQLGFCKYILSGMQMNTSFVIDNDPFEVNSDYLVLGGYSHDSGLYDPLIESGEFTLVQIYQIYARHR